MELKIRNVPQDELIQLDKKAKQKGVSREAYLRLVITSIAVEDRLYLDVKQHQEVLDRLIDTIVENNKYLDAIATHFSIEVY